MRRAGMTELARAADVPVATVDRALNGRERPRPETMSHIIAVAKAIGHPAALRLDGGPKPGAARRFGVVLHKQGQEFHKAFAEELRRAVIAERSVAAELCWNFRRRSRPRKWPGCCVRWPGAATCWRRRRSTTPR